MILKLLIGMLVVYAGWWLWRGPHRARPVLRRPGTEEAEARAILGVAPDDDADAIRAAHRRIVATVHPDRGGSPELARKVNAARDLLLKSLS